MQVSNVKSDPIADALAEFGGVVQILPPVIQYGPAHALMNIKGTLTEKRINIVEHASDSARLYFATMSGKVGKAARDGFGLEAVRGMAKAARAGNYLPVAQALAVVTGKSVVISKRASFEGQRDIMLGKISDLKDNGYVECKKTGALIPGGARKTIEKAIALIDAIDVEIAKL